MWKPPQRTRHELPILRAPSAAEAERARLFSPLTLASGLTLHERSWVPAMVPWRATEDGFVTQDVLDWYGRFADGQPGVIVVEATGIRDVPSGPLLRIGHDRFLPGLEELVRTVHRRSRGRTRLFIQIIDFLRIRKRPQRERYLGGFLEITEAHRANLADQLDDLRVARGLRGRRAAEAPRRSTTRRSTRSSTSARRRRCATASASASPTSSSPTSAISPPSCPTSSPPPRSAPGRRASTAWSCTSPTPTRWRRSSRPGTRARTATAARGRRASGFSRSEVYAAARARLGGGYALGCRFLCDDIIEGGSRVDDASFFGVAFARAGMDFLSLSTGGKFEDAQQPKPGEAAYPYTGPSGYECMPTALSDARGPFARQVPKQAQIRAAVRAAGFSTPTVVAGGLSTFDQVEGILERGEADLIGAARQSLADPDWFLKLRLGRGEEIRRCIYSNYCEGLDQKHKQVTCQLWDREEMEEAGLALTADGRRRLTPPGWRGRASG